jgi:hypothetical protein
LGLGYSWNRDERMDQIENIQLSQILLKVKPRQRAISGHPASRSWPVFRFNWSVHRLRHAFLHCLASLIDKSEPLWDSQYTNQTATGQFQVQAHFVRWWWRWHLWRGLMQSRPRIAHIGG